MSTLNVESISSNALLCGEGPHWDSAEQVLYYVNIDGGEVRKYNPATKKESIVKLDGKVSFVLPIDGQTIGEKNKFLIGLGHDFSILTWDGISEKPTSVESIATVDQVVEKQDNRINDGKADPTGRVWAGTMGPFHPSGTFVVKKGSLFSLSKDRKPVCHLTDITCSNGLAWTADNKTMYYIDSTDLKVDALDFDAQEGKVSNRRTAFDLKANNLEGFPDGMTIDTEGKLWVACFLGQQVIQVDPVSGKLLKTVPIPAPRVTSVTFGGKNLDELYVTSACVGMSEDDLKKHPLAGHTFRVTGVGAKGFPGKEVVL